MFFASEAKKHSFPSLHSLENLELNFEITVTQTHKK